MNRIIQQQNLIIPGLALTGFFEGFPYDRVQILGNSEILFLKQQTNSKRRSLLKQFFEYEIPCIVVANKNIPNEDLLKIASDKKICVFKTPISTSNAFSYLTEYLSDKFAPQTTVHGSLVDVYGVGLLFTGRSGIGKSEIALDLIERGHRLVADDVVTISRRGRGVLIGSSRTNIQHHLEIRGVGIIDVMSLYGIRGLRLRKRVEVEVQLEDHKKIEDFDRTGLDIHTSEYLGVEIPVLQIPIFPGKNITVIAETIALNSLLKMYGSDSAKEFNRRLIKMMKKKKFQHDRLDKFLE